MQQALQKSKGEQLQAKDIYETILPVFKEFGNTNVSINLINLETHVAVFKMTHTLPQLNVIMHKHCIIIITQIYLCLLKKTIFMHARHTMFQRKKFECKKLLCVLIHDIITFN